MFLVPDVLRNPFRYAAYSYNFHNYNRRYDLLRYDYKECFLSVARLVGAYGFHLLSKKALGDVSFAAIRENKLLSVGLLVGETALSVPTMLIHVGGEAIRNNLPALFKAWTKENVSSRAVSLGCFVLGVILLTTYVRSLQQDGGYNQSYKGTGYFVYHDIGYAETFLSPKAYEWAFKKFPNSYPNS